MKLKNITYCGIITALLCVLAPIAIPISGVPITLATLVIYVAASVTKPYVSIIGVLLYILLGCMGMPVFSGFSGGIIHILGPSGGFILGYIPLVICISILNKSKKLQIFGICSGTVLLYLSGCVGYMINTGCDVETPVSVCVLPFLPCDILKILISLTIISKIKYVLKKN